MTNAVVALPRRRPSFGLKVAQRQFERNPLTYIDGVVGPRFDTPGDYFALFVYSDGNYLDFGIVEGSMLVVDRKLPYDENTLNVYEMPVGSQTPRMQLSHSPIAGGTYVGRVVMAINQFE